MRYILFIIFLSLCGCSQLQRFSVSDQFVLTKEQLDSDNALILTDDKYRVILTKPTVENLKLTHDELTSLTKIDYSYMILDSDSYTYGAIIEDDRDYVALSNDFLNEFGEDREVIQDVSLHVLAHLKNGTTDNNARTRETSLFVIRQVISTAVSFFATPIAGYASSTAMSTAETGVKIAEENSANQLTFEWLKEGKITPCGFIKEKSYNDEHVGISSPKKYLLAHPGVDSRNDLAKDYIKNNSSIICVNHEKKNTETKENSDTLESSIESGSR